MRQDKKLLVAVIFFVLGGLATAQVNEAWVAIYNGPGNASDAATDIAVDGAGYIYVTGTSGGITTGNDYATIKYSPTGDTMWVRRYAGPVGSDGATAIVVDGSGNVYVTGPSADPLTGYDYATLKYAPNGDTVWVRRYSSVGNLNDEAVAIAVDNNGNTYVTGSSHVSGTNNDWLTIKYMPNGDTAWVRRYDGPANNLDWARAIAVDEFGNAYVTGLSEGIGTDADLTTIKYAPNGDALWTNRYNGPGDSTVSGPGSFTDDGRSIVVDDDGNVYVTGYSFGFGTYFDYVNIKYTSSGSTAWVRRHDGNDHSTDLALALAVDGNGNVYATGFTTGPPYGSQQYGTVGYSPDGDLMWSRNYAGPANSSDVAAFIDLDDLGNVYVTGLSIGVESDMDYATVRYTPDGNQAWVRRYNGPGNTFDEVNGIAVDGSGNVYVTGNSGGDYATVKYAPCPVTGDLNNDVKIGIVDLVYLINVIFKSWSAPGPTCLLDANGDSTFQLADVIYLANHVFKFGPAPVVYGVCCSAL